MEPLDVTLTSLHEEAILLRKAGHSFSDTERMLTERFPATADTITLIVKNLKTQHYLLCRKRGMVCLGLGVLLCGLVFLITFVQWQYGEPAPRALYGFTGTGATLVMAGGVQVLGL
ncbi:hypothetical protein [Arsenicibacter rosenii]|uniref:DUF2157 domain-containing protein n=1 Tax=Arsenicibacter rosenii TaxID=1750698 RepID=A0A1S2VL63_9BACT|nr:hypothetical protein [Arsenicibacter rosenii]OIN58965.1 hypothetical protein BLX24_12160 [Arsenicibacter rosenii]